MKGEQKGKAGTRGGGVRLSHLNVLLICVGVVLAALMAISMYRTTSSVKETVTFADDYISNQQTGGMLRDFASGMGGQAMAFVQSGEPGPALAYEGQMAAINAQLEQYSPETSNSEDANAALMEALSAFRERNATEKRAMRLAADTMPQGMMKALPAFLRNTELSEEDQALSPEEKKALAVSLLTAEDYTSKEEMIRTAVDLGHRRASEEGKIRAEKTSMKVNRIVGNQAILMVLVLIVAVLALLANRILVLSPMQNSVKNLNRREPIPEEGGYEMRRLARAYNEVLKENEEKTEALSYTASHDALTGVYNRDAFDKVYRQVENQEHIGLIVIDVDHFKQYNDDFGHDIGDKVLCTAVDAIRRQFGGVDHISRIGGDEFCIIMPGEDQEQAERIREKIIRINEDLAESSRKLPPITISAGIAFWDRPNPKGSLFKDADSALMELKKTRNDCCAVYNG